MTDPIKITITDPDLGTLLDERIIDNDYVVICAGDRYVKHRTVHRNGTHVVTIGKRTDD